MYNDNKLRQQLLNSTAIIEFLETYPDPRQVKETLWELLIAAMGSQHADMWEGENRAGMLFFYERMGGMLLQVYAIYQDGEAVV